MKSQCHVTCFLQTLGNVTQTTFSENQIWLWGHVKLEMSKRCKLLPDIGKWRLKIWTDCQRLCTPGLKFHERPIPSFQTSKRQPLPCFTFSSAGSSRWSERSPRSVWLVVNDSLWLVFSRFSAQLTVKADHAVVHGNVLKAWSFLILTACFGWFGQLVKLHPAPGWQCLSLRSPAGSSCLQRKLSVQGLLWSSLPYHLIDGQL